MRKYSKAIEEINDLEWEIKEKIFILQQAGVLTENIAKDLTSKIDSLDKKISNIKISKSVIIHSNKNAFAWKVLDNLCSELELRKTKDLTGIYKMLDTLSSDDIKMWHETIDKELKEKIDIAISNGIANKTWVRYISIALFSWLLGIICMA